MEGKGHRLRGIRLDSGYLPYLSKKSREILDNAGLDYVKIPVSNQLDEYIIQSLIEQKAPIDIFGVGTTLVTGYPDAALDGVYKLSFSHGKPRIKLSENVTKITLPDRKQTFRILEKGGIFSGADAIALSQEQDVDFIYHPLFPAKKMFTGDRKKEPLLQKVMEGGKRLTDSRTLQQIRDYSNERLDLLPGEYKRFNNPHVYKVGLSEKLRNERDRLIEEYKKP
jgi:nicotinate phosphoribosyltransferase